MYIERERGRGRERPQDDWERGKERERRGREGKRPQDDCPRVNKSLQVTRAAEGADEFLTHLAFNGAVFEVHAAELTQVQPLPA